MTSFGGRRCGGHRRQRQPCRRPPQIVPVLRRWEKALEQRAAALKDQEHLFKPGRTGAGKNLISNFVAKAKADGVHAQTQRMRSTWLVQQMAACTPLIAGETHSSTVFSLNNIY